MQTIQITVKPGTEQEMRGLESRGLISLIQAERIDLMPPLGETQTREVYRAQPEWGAHKLLSIAVNRTVRELRLGYHPDREDVLLTPVPAGTRELLWFFCFLTPGEFLQKATRDALTPADFTALSMQFGTRHGGWFTIHPQVIHGECTTAGESPCPVFYVTEPGDMPFIRVPQDALKIEIEGS